MKAVVVLGNFWMWSGGFPQYISWANGSTIPFPDIEGGSTWDPFINYSVSFYKNKKAQKYFKKHLKFMIGRTNSITGTAYIDDPTIMAWQLSNEPRGYHEPEAYRKWVYKTAKYVKSLDQNHLVSIGSEGNTNSDQAGIDLLKDNNNEYIDYCTTHVWIQNWSWFNPKDAGTFEIAVKNSIYYLRSQKEKAKMLKKPLVIEEFGVSRDEGNFDINASTIFRDMYFELIFNTTLNSIRSKDIIKGCNFWSWAGEGRPKHQGEMWQIGDDLIGDPPHERQGWYSVFDSDKSTISIINKYTEELKQLPKK
jgi:mannan endo-1,4-beta-mannosidase